MTDANETWQETVRVKEVDHFADGSTLENILGEFGEPGFSQVVLGIRNAELDADNIVMVTFTSYRNEDGKLLSAQAFYNKNGVHKPYIFYVHPDHMRMGIGTKMIDFIQTQFFETHGEYLKFEESWNGVVVSDIGLEFMNKYSSNALEKRKE